MISVYIVGRNCERTIAVALDSVVNQTRPADEIIYLDDASVDASLSIVMRYSDRRIRVLRHDSPKGIPVSRNDAVSACTGQWIAVLDADDCWAPDKLLRQLEFLRDHPKVRVLGTFAYLLNRQGQRRGMIEPPITDEEIRKSELTRNCFVHSSVLFRRDDFEKVGGYGDYATGQDYDLMLKLSERGEVANLPVPLIDYRLSDQSVSVVRRHEQVRCVAAAQRQARLRRGLAEHGRSGLRFRLQDVVRSLLSMHPNLRWGVYQLVLGSSIEGRLLLREVRPKEFKSRIVACFLLAIPNFVYRLLR